MNKKVLLAGLVVVLAFGVAPVRAGIDLNEVAAFLVFPGVAATAQGLTVETFLTITNTSSLPINAHVTFINGNENDTRYCDEHDFNVPMSGMDTETLVLTRVGNRTDILNLDTGASQSVSWAIGFVTVNVEDANFRVLGNNILHGEEVVVDYTNGAAFSVPAVSIQGGNENDGNRDFKFDEKEYRKFPSAIGGDFLAPDENDGRLKAYLVLFTLGFNAGVAPITSCEGIGFDAFEDPFSADPHEFGCWTLQSLESISPEFTYPNLGGSFDEQEHGWFYLNCEVFPSSSGGHLVGGVHGLIAQYAERLTDLRRNDASPTLLTAAAWARLLFQANTTGGEMTLELGAPFTGGNGF